MKIAEIQIATSRRMGLPKHKRKQIKWWRFFLLISQWIGSALGINSTIKWSHLRMTEKDMNIWLFTHPIFIYDSWIIKKIPIHLAHHTIRRFINGLVNYFIDLQQKCEYYLLNEHVILTSAGARCISLFNFWSSIRLKTKQKC